MGREQKSVYYLVACLGAFAVVCFLIVIALDSRSVKDMLIPMGLSGAAAAYYFWLAYHSPD
jgi:hypothetical protein